jgi:hypothetical protein
MLACLLLCGLQLNCVILLKVFQWYGVICLIASGLFARRRDAFIALVLSGSEFAHHEIGSELLARGQYTTD